jgi:RND family efflux transporter MFP subunit
MTEKQKRIYKLIGMLLPVLAVGLVVVMVKTKPKAERKKMSSMIPVVESTLLHPISTAVVVQCMGTVIADREASLEAEVNGRITEILPGLVEGSLVGQGDVLITIDPRDYELAVDEARASLQRAESSLRLEEGSQAVTQHEMELIGAGTKVDPAYQDLMLRKPQLQTAQANINTAKANLADAQLNLERTQIRAPFDAVVQAVNVSEGDTARSGKALVKLVAKDRLFVRASLPVGSLELFPNLGKTNYPARITLADGAVCTGNLYKMLPDLSEGGRMARMLIAVSRPFDSETVRPLLLDEVARIEITGRTVENVCLMDRTNLRDGSVIWMIDPAEHLHICPVELVQGYTDQVLVRTAFSNGWELITSDIPAPVDGMKLRIYTEKEGVH